MKKAIITGIFGQDGCLLARQLNELGYQIIGVSKNHNLARASWLKSEIPSIGFAQIDITNLSEISKLIESVKPDEIYNLAGFSSVRDSWNNRDLTNSVNFVGVQNILNASLKYQNLSGKKVRIYQASSSEIFGSATESPQDENTIFSPTSPYGKSKLAGHLEAIKFRDNYDLFVGVGILFNHESPLRNPEFVTRKITLESARIFYGKSSAIELGNLNVTRDWGYAGDYVDAMRRIVQYPEPETFVIATGISTTVSRIAEIALTYVGVTDWQSYLKFNKSEIRPIEPINLVGNSSKALDLLSWKSTKKIKDTIEMMVEHDIAELKGT